MTQIQSTGQGGGAGLVPPPQDAPATSVPQGASPVAQAGMAALSPAQMQQISEILSLYATALKAAAPTSASGVTTDGVTDANGAPELPGGIALTSEDLPLLIMHLSSESANSAIGPLKERLQTQNLKSQELNQRAIEKIHEAIKKAKAEAARRKSGGIMGWVMKVAAVVACVVAVAVTVATAGAAAPIAVMAMMALCASLMSLASDISQAKGGPALQPSALVAQGLQAMFIEFGMDPEQARLASQITSGAIAMLAPALMMIDPSFAGQFAGGIATAAGADAATAGWINMGFTMAAVLGSFVVMVACGRADAAVRAGTNVKTIAVMAQAVPKLVEASTGIAKSVNDMELAAIEKAQAKLQADSSRLDALIARIARLMEENQDQIKVLVENLQSSEKLAMDVLNASQHMKSRMAAAIGHASI